MHPRPLPCRGSALLTELRPLNVPRIYTTETIRALPVDKNRTTRFNPGVLLEVAAPSLTSLLDVPSAATEEMETPGIAPGIQRCERCVILFHYVPKFRQQVGDEKFYALCQFKLPPVVSGRQDSNLQLDLHKMYFHQAFVGSTRRDSNPQPPRSPRRDPTDLYQLSLRASPPPRFGD